MTMPEAISPKTARLLKDVTGETQLNAAVLATLEDALVHRLESIEEEIDELEAEHGMDWEEFRAAWDEGEIEDAHSLEVEETYWRWEELETRRSRIQEALSWVP